MVKVNVSRTLFSLSIAISVALTPNLRKLNFSQISQRMSESFKYVGPALTRRLLNAWCDWSGILINPSKTFGLIILDLELLYRPSQSFLLMVP